MLEFLPGIPVVGTVPVQAWILPSQAQVGQKLGAAQGSFNCRVQKCRKTGFLTSKRPWNSAGVRERTWWALGWRGTLSRDGGSFIPGWRGVLSWDRGVSED